jgi:multicomponent Na+:H+ antiporter subunit G
MMLLAWTICVLAMAILLISAIGIIRLPDALARQHAATKAATLAVSLFAFGLALAAATSGWGWAWIWRLLVIVLALMMTLPLASHALARAGAQERKADPP